MSAISSTSSSNAYYLAHGGYFLNSLTTSGNWLLNSVSNDTGNWLSSSATDVVNLAANAFAKAHIVNTTTNASLAVNKGIQTQQSALTALSTGQSLDIFA
jgi:hypothetical protein